MRNYWFMMLVVGVLSACSDFLEPKSQSEYVPKDAVSLNEMLLGESYPKAGSSSTNVMSILLTLDDDVCYTDSLGTIPLGGSLRFNALRALFSWQPNPYKLLKENSINYNQWDYYYVYIRGTNAALDYVNDVSGTYNEKTVVKAQALALRAYYYFQLVNFYGVPYNEDKKGLGVPLKTTSAMENKELSRNTVEEVYAQILSDLDEAEKLYESLPEDMQFKKDYRTTLPMVQLLRSRVLLYMEDWKNAAIYARKVIDNPKFSLMNLNALPAKTEQKPYFNFISMENTQECVWVFGCISEYTALVDENLEILKDPSVPMGDTRYHVDLFNAAPELLNLFVEGDLRKENYIVKGRNKESLEYGGSVIHPGGYCPFGKFAINSEHSPESGRDFAHAFRLSEAYLNLAEAAAADNDSKTALWALNELRRNRFTPEAFEEVSGINGQALVDRVRLERRLELCYEGHRWFDLRRYGMPSFTRVWKDNGQPVQAYTLKEKDPFYTLPIPQEVLDKNRGLVQNKLANPR